MAAATRGFLQLRKKKEKGRFRFFANAGDDPRTMLLALFSALRWRLVRSAELPKP